MDEMVPRGRTEAAAGWDGIERRSRPAGPAMDGVERRAQLMGERECGGVPWWRDPQRMSGTVLAQMLGGLGTVVLVAVAGFVATRLQIHWR